jgi:hypothetical protein
MRTMAKAAKRAGDRHDKSKAQLNVRVPAEVVEALNELCQAEAERDGMPASQARILGRLILDARRRLK